MEMSDSSIGDSLFSYPSQRRYFGSSESCRFDFECRRCSFDDEKCGFSDTCRYDCRNCDCSSSYFSSDFDEASFGRNNSARGGGVGPCQTGTQRYVDDTIDMKTSRYAEDFIKHIANVKKNSVYQTVSNPTYSYSGGMSATGGYARPIDAIDEAHFDGNARMKVNQKCEYGSKTEPHIERHKPQQPHHHYESIAKYLKSSDKSSSSKSGSSKSSPIIGDSAKMPSRTGAIPKVNQVKIGQTELPKQIDNDYDDIVLYTKVTKKIVNEKEPLRKNNSLPRSVREQKLVQKCENLTEPRVTVGEILKYGADNRTVNDEVETEKRLSKKKLSEKVYSSPAKLDKQPRQSCGDDDDDVFDLTVTYEAPKYSTRERVSSFF